MTGALLAAAIPALARCGPEAALGWALALLFGAASGRRGTLGWVGISLGAWALVPGLPWMGVASSGLLARGRRSLAMAAWGGLAVTVLLRAECGGSVVWFDAVFLVLAARGIDEEMARPGPQGVLLLLGSYPTALQALAALALWGVVGAVLEDLRDEGEAPLRGLLTCLTLYLALLPLHYL